jgi:hypothetical protein
MPILMPAPMHVDAVPCCPQFRQGPKPAYRLPPAQTPQVRSGRRMKVILNSDVLHHEGTLVREKLMPPLVRLFEVCRDQRHEVVIPLTTRLEFDRYQLQMAEDIRRTIKDAYTVLDSHEIRYEKIDPETLGPAPDLIALIRKIGPSVSELAPTNDELVEAHRRAALHLPPHPSGNTKSDEMRDLVIWLQAIRLAREGGGAMLISRDGLHTNSLGDDEAIAVKLLRVSKLDEAVEHLEVRTPPGKEFERLLNEVWADLVAAEPDLPRRVELRSVLSANFREGEIASASIRAMADDQLLTADVTISLNGTTVGEAKLENVRLGEKRLKDIRVTRQPKQTENEADLDERLARLREVLRS